MALIIGVKCLLALFLMVVNDCVAGVVLCVSVVGFLMSLFLRTRFVRGVE